MAVEKNSAKAMATATLTTRKFIQRVTYGVFAHGELGIWIQWFLIDHWKKMLFKKDDNIKELQEYDNNDELQEDDNKDELQDDDNKDEVNRHDDCNIEEPDGPNKVEDKENGNSFKFGDFLVKDVEMGRVYNATKLIADVLQDILRHAKTNDEVAKLNNILTTINKCTIREIGDLIVEYNITAPETNNILLPPYQLNPFYNASKDPIKNNRDMHHDIRKNIIDHLCSELNSCHAKLPYGVLRLYTDKEPKTGASGHCLFRFKEPKVLQHVYCVDHTDKSHPDYHKVQNLRILMVMQNSKESPEPISLQDAVSKGIVANELVAYFIGTIYESYKCVGMNEKLRFKQQGDAECWVAEVQCSCSDHVRWIECTEISGKNDVALEAKMDPIEVEELVVKPVLWKLMPKFENNSKKVVAALKAIGEKAEEARKMMADLESKGEYKLFVGTLRKEITIERDMLLVTKEKKTVYNRVSTVYYAYVSFRIGPIICCLYEHAFYIRDGTSLKVFRFPPLVAPFECCVIADKTCNTDPIIKSLDKANIRYTTAKQGNRYKNRFIESDECGCPYAILVNSDKSVTIRERDNNLEIRVKVDGMGQLIKDLLCGVLTWTDAQKYTSGT